MAELFVQQKKVHYEVHGDQGEPIVLLNGIMMTAASWRPFLPAMTQHNRVVLVDFFDQGNSARMEEAYGHGVQVELLDAVLKTVSEQIRVERFALMGISYGGEIAIQYALAHPECVRKLVLANTCGRTSPWLKKIGDGWNAVAKTGNGTAYYLTAIPVIYSTRFFEEHAVWMERREAHLCKYFSRSDVREALIRLTDSSCSYDVMERLHEIICPTLILSSSEDALVPPTEQQLLHERIRASRLVTINGSGHASMYEEPELFTALVVGFVNLPDDGIQI